MPITEFKGDYKFLSNFYYLDQYINNIKFLTNEHYFQAMKTTCYEDYMMIANLKTPSEAKKQGRIIQIRSDWELIKDQVMEYGLYVKFQHNPMRQKLLETGNEELVEGNWWGDEYWGFSFKTNKGLNMLGKLLMQLRSRFVAENEYQNNISCGYTYIQQNISPT